MNQILSAWTFYDVFTLKDLMGYDKTFYSRKCYPVPTDPCCSLISLSRILLLILQ